jgi:hypothetical protein
VIVEETGKDVPDIKNFVRKIADPTAFSYVGKES